MPRRKNLVPSLLIIFSLASYLFMAILALSPFPVIGKISPLQPALQKNDFTRSLLGVFQLNTRNYAKLVSMGIATMAVIWILYFILIYQITRKGLRLRLRSLVLIAGACCLFVTLSPPILSRDIFSMIFYGKIGSFYDLNPYLVKPQYFISDPMLALISTNWKNTGMVYGPLAGMICSFSFMLWGHNIVANVIFLKSLMTIAHLFNIYLIYKIKNIGEENNPNPGLAIYALNPLVILHSAGGGHFDVLMMTLVLLALLRYEQKRDWDSFALLILASTLKYVTILPAFTLVIFQLRKRYALRDKVNLIIAYFVIALIVIVALYYPYFSSTTIFKPLFANMKLVNVVSVGFVIRKTLQYLLMLLLVHSGIASDISNIATAVVLISAFILLIYYILKDNDKDEEMGKIWLLSLTSLLFTLSYLLPWYFIWIIALIPFRKWDRYNWLLFGLTVIGFALAADIWL